MTRRPGLRRAVVRGVNRFWSERIDEEDRWTFAATRIVDEVVQGSLASERCDAPPPAGSPDGVAVTIFIVNNSASRINVTTLDGGVLTTAEPAGGTAIPTPSAPCCASSTSRAAIAARRDRRGSAAHHRPRQPEHLRGTVKNMRAARCARDQIHDRPTSSSPLSGRSRKTPSRPRCVERRPSSSRVRARGPRALS